MVAPPDRSGAYDDLAAVLVRRLNQPVLDERAVPRPAAAFWSSLLTFGLWPAVVWPLRFNLFAAVQREQLVRFAEWAAWRDAGQGRSLVESAERVRVRSRLAAAPVVLCLAVVGAFASAHWHPHPLQFALYHTYRSDALHGLDPGGARLYWTWVLGLGAAHLCQFALLHLHARDVRRFVQDWNAIATGLGAGPVTSPQVVTSVRCGWAAVAVVMMAALHAPWAMAMAISGAAQRRYLLETDPSLRAELAGQVVRLAGRQPAPPLPAAERRTAGRCGRPRCGAPLAESARFCPRCGAAVAPRVSRTA